MRLFVVALIALTAVAVACGDGGDEPPGVTPTPTMTAAERAAAVCGAAPGGEVVGTVSSPDLVEISGLVASRAHSDVLWVHNDSGDTARVFAIARQGGDLGTYVLEGVEANDWEDMAIGPGPVADVDYLYLADIGDNPRERPEIDFYRVAEPDLDVAAGAVSETIADVEKLTLQYPAEAHDAETLLVDPVSGDLLIVTKELTGGSALVFRAPGSLEAGSTSTLEQVGEIDFSGLESQVDLPDDAPALPLGAGHLPTGGDVSPAGDVIAIRTYSTVWVWPRTPGTELWEAFDATPCEGPSEIEPQGEALGFDAAGTGYFTASEGVEVPIYHFGSP